MPVLALAISRRPSSQCRGGHRFLHDFRLRFRGHGDEMLAAAHVRVASIEDDCRLPPGCPEPVTTAEPAGPLDRATRLPSPCGKTSARQAFAGRVPV